jgi:tetraprenyl-beta-curcumene synthase
MSTAAHTDDGHARNGALAQASRPAGVESRGPLAEHLDLGVAFTGTLARYLFCVLPSAASELAQWRSAVAEIPNPKLRHHALHALSKRGNIEGAALFATLAPAIHRRRTVRALVAYQTAYNYLDALSELPSRDPIANGERLHQALLIALGRVGAESRHPDYYEHNPDTGDGGYLNATVDACRRSLTGLPSYDAVAPTARAAARRIVKFQALNLSEGQGGHEALRAWATEATPAGTGLEWWETAAAAGSSLAVHALIAAAASPDVDSSDAREIDRAYFPWVGALHSLLDSLVDRDEDRERGQRSLLDYYSSPAAAATGLGCLATRARRATERLSAASADRVIVTAMCSYYLSAPQCETPESDAVSGRLAEALGLPLNVAIAIFRVRRLASALAHHAYT